MKLLNSVKVFHALLRQHYNNNKILLPLLLIIKTLAKNRKQATGYIYIYTYLRSHRVLTLSRAFTRSSVSSTAFSLQTLAKDGITSTLEKTFVSVGYAPHLKLRTLLECLKHFTTNSTYAPTHTFPFFSISPIVFFLFSFLFARASSDRHLQPCLALSELCCNKLVKVGIVHLLMRIFERWERFDGPMRLKICNYALNTLQHLCAISKFGSASLRGPREENLLITRRTTRQTPRARACVCVCGSFVLFCVL